MEKAANNAAIEKSASSRTMAADLPPSSRNTRLSVSLAAAMIRRPVAVEPVNVTTSTSGLVVSTAPTSGSDELSTFTTPAGMSVWLAISSPSASVTRGVSGAPFKHNGASGGERGRQLGQRELVGVVVGDDRRDHPGGLFLHPAVVLHASALDVAEVFGHRIVLQQIGVVADDRDRLVELRTRAQRPGGADLGDGQVGQLVTMLDQRTVKLIKTADSELDVGGPVRRVKRTPRRSDRRLGLRHGRVGSVPHEVASWPGCRTEMSVRW